MNEPRTTVYLMQMRDAAADAQIFVADMDKETFLTDRRTQRAVVMSLMIVGEAAARMVDRHFEFTAQHQAVPWIAMRGLRNRIAHGYFQVDMEVVWATVQDALPDLLNALAPLLKQS